MIYCIYKEWMYMPLATFRYLIDKHVTDIAKSRMRGYSSRSANWSLSYWQICQQSGDTVNRFHPTYLLTYWNHLSLKGHMIVMCYSQSRKTRRFQKYFIPSSSHREGPLFRFCFRKSICFYNSNIISSLGTHSKIGKASYKQCWRWVKLCVL